MSAKQERIIWPALIIVALSAGIFAFASGRQSRSLETKPLSGQQALTSLSAADDSHVRYAALDARLRWNLKQLGDRLDRLGKERLTLTGTLTRADDPQPFAAVVILEFPDR